MRDAANLLLVTHVPIRHGPSGLQIDDQTAAGIAQWCRHFDRLTYYGIAEDTTAAKTSSSSWVDTADRFGSRAEIIALPRAYRVGAMLKEFTKVRATLRRAVMEHRHLCFTIGGVVGDWPALAALESFRQKRRYGAWIDRVEAPVIQTRLAGASLGKKLAAVVTVPLGEMCTHYLLRHSAVALLQGGDTFGHYARWASDPHCTYDTHTIGSDWIVADAVAAKRRRLLAGGPIRIIYAGRATAMKGPQDWLDALELLHAQQIPFRATWLGDGSELPVMRQRVAASGLKEIVETPGFDSDREKLLRRLRESDMLLFCHKTPESARCLIEALVSGCPLVGYDSAYSRGLVEAHGGAALSRPNDPSMLADQIATLHHDRPAFARLIEEAAASGRQYDEDSVYAHRADLMRRA